VHEIFERRQAAIRRHGKGRNDGNPALARFARRILPLQAVEKGWTGQMGARISVQK